MLSDRELLALVLRSGRRGRSALAVSDDLLEGFGGLKGLAHATIDDLAQVQGVGLAKASSVVAALELGSRRHRPEAMLARKISSPEGLIAAVRHRLQCRPRELVDVLVLDGANRVRRVCRLSSGGADQALVPVRDVLQVVLKAGGSGFAVAHNHPSGDERPSESDVQVTRMLSEASGLVGLRFVDHIIFGDDQWVSLRRLGYVD